MNDVGFGVFRKINLRRLVLQAEDARLIGQKWDYYFTGITFFEHSIGVVWRVKTALAAQPGAGGEAL